MKTRNLIIICLTILLVILAIGVLWYIEDVSETPYEICLERCKGSSTGTGYPCVEMCNEDFKEVIEILTDKFIPLLERLIDLQEGK